MNKSRTVLLLVIALAGLLAACQPTGDAIGAALDPDTVVLSWRRSGGIAGFCDEMTITAAGEVTGTNCQGSDGGTVAAAELSRAQQAQLDGWLGALKPFEYAESDGAVSDAMRVEISFDGQGGNNPSLAEQRAVLAFATDRYAQLGP